MDAQVQEILPKLAAAVELVMNPSTPQQERIEAYKACEDFKENSPLCAQCGLIMASRDQSPFIRHFGLQLLEHCVKYRWTKINVEEKVFIKDNTMTLIAKGTHDMLKEQMHIKDVLSRTVVEMIKQEWPQQWPSLFTELYQLCLLGNTQKELVLMVFLRLAEDTMLLQTVPTRRRKELAQGLNANMADIFSFFMETLKASVTEYHSLVQSGGDADQASRCCRVAQAALATLGSYVDWVNPTYVFEKDCQLLEMLCILLKEPEQRLQAVECLLTITSRRGKLEDRTPLMMLFKEQMMHPVMEAAVQVINLPCEEKSYLFLKRLGQVLTSLGGQLCALMSQEREEKVPANFDQFLRVLLVFAAHPSKVICSYIYPLLASFFRHEILSQDETLLSIMMKLLETTRMTLVKLGFPSQKNSPSCAFSALDFDSDEEFNVFFSKTRSDIAETVRQATLLCPMLTFSFASSWLEELLQKPVDVGDGTESGHCNLSSPSFLEWDALTVLLESVMSRVMISEKPKPNMEEGIRLLKAVLEFSTQDPLILSCVLSCVSALFPVITHASDILPTVLNKIFAAATFSLEGQTKATRSKAVLNARRHACSVLVKICKSHPALLLPAFDQLYSHIQKLSSDPDQLSQMEKCTLTEALILISNEFKSFDKQSLFIKEVLNPVRQHWLDKVMKSAVWSADKFLNYVGLDQAPVEPSSEDTCGINRSLITYCINTMLVVLKRAKSPDNLETAQSGGFLSTKDDGTTVLRNPATPHIIPLLDNVLALTRTMNELWLTDYLQKRHQEFSKAYELMEVEKLNILGIQPPLTDNTDSLWHKHPLERMQSFVLSAFDNSCHILGNAGMCLGHDFYSAPNLASSLLKSVLTHLEIIPDYRLKTIIRVFMKPYIQYCPPDLQQSAIIPVLTHLCPTMMNRLSAKWQIINQRGEAVDAEENVESQEVLDDQLTRLLTREYIEMIGLLFRIRRGGAQVTDDSMAVDEDESAVQSQAAKDDSLSELGVMVLDQDSIYASIVILVFSALSWSDTSTCNKAASLCWPIVKQLLATKKLMGDDACHLFIMILQGLQMNGQHEGCLSFLLTLGLQTYEHMRPLFPDIVNVMQQIPNANKQALETFDENLLNPQAAYKPSEKKKKEVFKKLVSEMIGKNIGQRFKKESEMNRLPPMVVKSKAKNKPLIDTATQDIGLCSLFQSDPDVC